MFFFANEESFNKNQNKIKNVFSNKNSTFYTTLKEFGIEKINFVKNPLNGKSMFFYNNDLLLPDKNAFELIEKDKKYIAIIILDKYLGDIERLIKNYPENVIVQPILAENIDFNKIYILKSYVYKIIRFMNGNIPYLIKELQNYEKSCFIGIDINHDIPKQKSTLVFTAVNTYGEILYIKKHKDIELNEKIQESIFQDEIINICNIYNKKNQDKLETVFIYRDGKYIEDIYWTVDVLRINEVKSCFIEINKNSEIVPYENEKGNTIKIDEKRYIYYPVTFLEQKGVMVEIIHNDTDIENIDIIKQAYTLTGLHHGSPYTNIKLPYPVYIADKIARTDLEWRLYIPYLKIINHL